MEPGLAYWVQTVHAERPHSGGGGSVELTKLNLTLKPQTRVIPLLQGTHKEIDKKCVKGKYRAKSEEIPVINCGNDSHNVDGKGAGGYKCGKNLPHENSAHQNTV